ncbi:FabD/lysophospholipase-like protein [Aspergillus fijiensis CBS 313.89]|uniref:FabD/lysophospholipase-like protein n=1 Tax=Aspergillus fijiensis CBS 313.89 TaxID=1448319 RepID=A0A8G1RQM2_9EURO|nr:FabD/lysophospholipase-like protein [Aspergillus fijiensis CBS 313.89]RAK77675.1 FabD/lysophospholipase-like protein [Aspergillus fijiensis CBS 313.89]
MTDSCEPLRVLSLDGGGIRGISSLLILERIMERIRDVKCLDEVPRPCEYFDLIGGTSTGGIIAIMLGRLGMSTDECIKAYKKVAQQSFTPKRTSILPASPRGAFSAKALESAIKRIVREYCTDADCITRRSDDPATIETCPHSDMVFRDHTCKKTVVLASTKDNVDAPPTLFRTYDSSTAFETASLWQVARATSAATTFFKSIKVGRDRIEFVDAGFGYNNPCEILTREAQQVYPERRTMRILSIGTGLGDVVTIQDKRSSIITALKKMVTSSKEVAARMHHRYGNSGEYYRFNVEHGLQDITLSDWEETSKISAHTGNYLTENEREINRFVESFVPCGGSENGKGAHSTVNDITQTIPTTAYALNRENARPKAAYESQPHKSDQALPDDKTSPSFCNGEIADSYSVNKSKTQSYPERGRRYKPFQGPERRLSSNLSYGCSTCSSKMHPSRKCPWAGKDELRCNRCRQFGHWEEDCKPNAPCKKCRSKGHSAEHCLYDRGCFLCYLSTYPKQSSDHPLTISIIGGQYDHWNEPCRWKQKLENWS